MAGRLERGVDSGPNERGEVSEDRWRGLREHQSFTEVRKLERSGERDVKEVPLWRVQ